MEKKAWRCGEIDLGPRIITFWSLFFCIKTTVSFCCSGKATFDQLQYDWSTKTWLTTWNNVAKPTFQQRQCRWRCAKTTQRGANVRGVRMFLLLCFNGFRRPTSNGNGKICVLGRGDRRRQLSRILDVLEVGDIILILEYGCRPKSLRWLWHGCGIKSFNSTSQNVVLELVRPKFSAGAEQLPRTLGLKVMTRPVTPTFIVGLYGAGYWAAKWLFSSRRKDSWKQLCFQV